MRLDFLRLMVYLVYTSKSLQVDTTKNKQKKEKENENCDR